MELFSLTSSNLYTHSHHRISVPAVSTGSELWEHFGGGQADQVGGDRSTIPRCTCVKTTAEVHRKSHLDFSSILHLVAQRFDGNKPLFGAMSTVRFGICNGFRRTRDTLENLCFRGAFLGMIREARYFTRTESSITLKKHNTSSLFSCQGILQAPIKPVNHFRLKLTKTGH